MEEGCKIFYSLKMGSFGEVMHRDIYQAINNVATTGSRIDLITVKVRFNGEAPLGLKTGLVNLDKILAPKNILPGSLVAIGARPKMGKTAFTLKIAEYIAIEEGKGIATFSLEMPKEQIYERMVSSRARID